MPAQQVAKARYLVRLIQGTGAEQLRRVPPDQLLERMVSYRKTEETLISHNIQSRW